MKADRVVTLILCASVIWQSQAFQPSRRHIAASVAFRCPSIARSAVTDSMVSSTIAATELPDSLGDAAVRAAEATAAFGKQAGPSSRCRVDFDTSIGDETYTLLKTSTDFMQQYVSALCYAMIPGAQQRKQDQLAKVASARAELKQIYDAQEEAAATDDTKATTTDQARIDDLNQIVASQGTAGDDDKWTGPVARIYFPDEGNAALARRDWLGGSSTVKGEAKVPDCVQFSSCGSVEQIDVSNDRLVLFFCPRASESEAVEKILVKSETHANELALTVFVNPNLVDMGVTGFGMAGRLLRERLIDPLQTTYYLRTLPWGALTRQWPAAYTVWQEDADAEGGYKLISTLDRLPSNPEVEDIYDSVNESAGKESGGIFGQLGDFVNGMMRL